jgi:adenosylcobinamide-GDP ribazoletransferase
MIASVLVTGAFHEDGFADVCDGFGGGWTKEKIDDERQCNWRVWCHWFNLLLLLLKYQGLTQLIAVRRILLL